MTPTKKLAIVQISGICFGIGWGMYHSCQKLNRAQYQQVDEWQRKKNTCWFANDVRSCLRKVSEEKAKANEKTTSEHGK